MPQGGFGRGGSGGSGLSLGPPTNKFNAANRNDAEDLRDDYGTANADWLAQYDAEPSFLIEITWPVSVNQVRYQARRGGDWVNVTTVIQGPPGITALDGLGGSAASNELRFVNGNWQAVSTIETIYMVMSRANTFESIRDIAIAAGADPEGGGYSRVNRVWWILDRLHTREPASFL